MDKTEKRELASEELEKVTGGWTDPGVCTHQGRKTRSGRIWVLDKTMPDAEGKEVRVIRTECKCHECGTILYLEEPISILANSRYTKEKF